MQNEGYYQQEMNSNVPGDAATGYITSFMGWTPAGNWGMRFQWNHRKVDGTIISGKDDGYYSHKGALRDLREFLKGIA